MTAPTDSPPPLGIVPSVNTPFTADDQLDTEGLTRLADHLVDSGCAGTLILAVAGETGRLTPDERDLLAETVLARIGSRLPVIVGLTAESWEESLARAELARRLGAWAVLWQPPPETAEAELAAGLEDLARAGPGAVMLQDLDWGGGGFPIETILRLHREIPAFQAIKVETVPAGPKYSALLEATGGALHVSGGWAVSQMTDALARGVHAFMPTGMEPIYSEIFRRHRAGQIEDARALFERILPVLAFANQHIDVSIRFFKRLRQASGLFATDRCRPPVPKFDAIQAAECDRLLRLAQNVESELTAGT